MNEKSERHVLGFTIQRGGLLRLVRIRTTQAARQAVDSPAFLARLVSPVYETNQRLTITGYNLMALCGV